MRIRGRRPFINALCGSLALVVLVAGWPGGVLRPTRATFEPRLVNALREAGPTERMMVFVRANNVTTAKRAAADRHLKVIDTFDKVGVAVAHGTAQQIRSLADARDVKYVQGESKWIPMLDTSHQATRGQALHDGFDATVTEVSPTCEPVQNVSAAAKAAKKAKKPKRGRDNPRTPQPTKKPKKSNKPKPTATPSPTASPTASPTTEPTPTPTPTPTATPTTSPSATPTPTSTPTTQPTSTPCGTDPITTTKHLQATGEGVSVAVVDSGIDGTHPMFQKDGISKVVRNLKLACNDSAVVLVFPGTFDIPVPPPTCPEVYGVGENPFVEPGAVRPEGNDTDTISQGGHGTHVAGIAAGYDVDTVDDKHLHGAAAGAKLIGLSVAQVSPFYGANAGLNWVLDNHAAPCGSAPSTDCPPIKVVNNSYGPDCGGEFDPNDVTTAIQDELVDEGVTVVWSAGNGCLSSGGGNGSDNRVGPPAQDPKPGIISVANYDDGATGTRDGSLDSSSSRGEIGRPETYPDISAPGSNIRSACRPYLPICSSGGDTADPDYNTISGTSMAAPHIVGIAAQLLELKPSLTPADIENILEDTAYKFGGSSSYEADPGNADDTTSFDKGHGLVDVKAAAIRALGYDDEQGTEPTPTPSPTGTPTPAEPVTYYAHHLGGCVSGATPGPFMDLTNSDGDDDGCGSLGLGSALGFEVEAWPSTVGSPYHYPAGSHVSGTLYVQTDVPAQLQAEITILRGGSTPVGIGTADSRTSFGVADGYLPIPFEFNTEGVIEAGDPLTMSVKLPTTPSQYFGYEGDHATSFTIGQPVVPNATLSPGSGDSWTGEPVTNVSDVTGCRAISGEACGRRYLKLNVPAGGGTFDVEVTTAIPLEDFDLYVFGPDGAEVDSSANPGTINPDTGEFSESVSIAVPTSGLYTVLVRAYVTAESVFEATATLS